MTVQRTLIGYLFLVGFPLLGLLATLEAGRSITPPPAISGEWTVKWDSIPPPTPNCSSDLAQISDFRLKITQYGAVVNIASTAPYKINWTANVSGNQLEAKGLLVENGAVCKTQLGLILSANIAGALDSRIMSGTLHFHGCTSCRPLTFHAYQTNTPVKRS